MAFEIIAPVRSGAVSQMACRFSGDVASLGRSAVALLTGGESSVWIDVALDKERGVVGVRRSTSGAQKLHGSGQFRIKSLRKTGVADEGVFAVSVEGDWIVIDLNRPVQ